MKNILGLTGRSGVGKSTVAMILSDNLGITLRQCGEEVKKRQSLLRCDSLPPSEHEAIDKETQLLVRNSSKPLIVEGRYLLEVLKGLGNLLLIELICSDLVSENRKVIRNTCNCIQDLIVNEDVVNCSIKESFDFGASFIKFERGYTFVKLDTDSLTVSQTVAKVRCIWQEYQKPD